MDKNILPECYADTVLAETLVPTRIGYNHTHGCNEVGRAMKHGRLKDNFALGIIDDDKTKLLYLKECFIADEVLDFLTLWKHHNKPHYIIQISPALEEWILAVCDQTGIWLEDFGIPHNLKGLRKITKSKTSLEDKNLRDLFAAIKTCQDHEPVRKLTHWITTLRDKNYQADLNELKNG